MLRQTTLFLLLNKRICQTTLLRVNDCNYTEIETKIKEDETGDEEDPCLLQRKGSSWPSY